MTTAPASVIYRRIPACDQALVREAATYGVADLHESMSVVAGRMALLSPAMKALNPGVRIAGQAVTAQNYPGDALAVHKAIQLALAGQVVVCTGGGGTDGAMLGELLATYAAAKGIAGIVIEGSIRDTDRLREMRFPVWATSISAAHDEKRGPAAVNVPIVCAGTAIQPGDVIAADGDGVLAIPRHLLAGAVAGARARASQENTVRERLRGGDALFDIMGIQSMIEAAGLEERDCTWQDDEERR